MVPGPTESARMFTTENAPLMKPKPRPDTEVTRTTKGVVYSTEMDDMSIFDASYTPDLKRMAKRSNRV